MFARRSTHRLFVALACGMILADRSTVVAMTAAAGMARPVAAGVLVLFRRECRDVDDLGLAVARLVVTYLIPPGAAAGPSRRGRDVLQALGA